MKVGVYGLNAEKKIIAKMVAASVTSFNTTR